MARFIVNPSFERWVQYIFDHPVTDPEWYWDDDEDNNYEFYDPEQNPEQAVTYMNHLFTSPVEHTKPYNEAQIGQGFNYLISPSISNNAFYLFDVRVPLVLRREAINNIYNVFEKLFAPRCTPQLNYNSIAKTDIPEHTPLNHICFMWWDIMPLSGPSQKYSDMHENETLRKQCLKVMTRTLDLDSIACRESALHGLGHIGSSFDHRPQVEKVIDAFLAREPDLDPDLRNYALGARQGAIL